MFWMRTIASSSTRRHRATVVLVGIMAIVLVWLASMARPWQGVEYKVFDLLTALTAPRKSDVPLVILAIDEPSFGQLQTQWPFPRHLHAQVLDRLRADGARAVGFDVVFAEPSNAVDDAALARALHAGPPTVLAASREKTESGNASLWTEVLPLDAFLQAGAVTGQVHVAPDDDFVVRRSMSRDDAFATRLAALAATPLASAVATGQEGLIEYLGPRGTFDTRSYYQALEPGLLPQGFFKDKIVLIGRSVRTAVELAGSRSDMFNSPFALTDSDDRLFPGVEVQANLVSNVLTGGGLRGADALWSMALVAAMAALLAGVGLRAHPGATAVLAVSLAAGVWALSYALFAYSKIWLAPLFPSVAILAAYGVSMLVNYVASRKRALQMRMMFSQYVPQEVVARLVERPDLLKLGGEVRELTLMFTDLANFTAMSERLTAQATVEVLTEYFNTMTPIIHRHGGTVDKFIGDAVMAFWGAPLDDPLHAQHAVRAAIDMQVAMDGLAQRLSARGLPAIAMRIGVHTGRVVVGNIGSHSRFSYTVIGDAVNLAARLEGANKAFGTAILLSDATASLLPPEMGLRHLDTVVVKGKSEAVNVYTPCSDPALSALSAAAVKSFYLQQWETCESEFSKILLLKPHDSAALRFLKRMADFREKPLATHASMALSLDKL